MLDSVLEQAGRGAVGVRNVTPQEAVDLFGGGAEGKKRLASELGVNVRTVQRYTTTTGTQRRAPRIDVRVRLDRAGRIQAGAQALREQGLTIAPGSELQTCYGGEPEGPRDLTGFGIPDNAPWLDAYRAGDYDEACAEFNQALFDDYGADALNLCDDEEQEVRIE